MKFDRFLRPGWIILAAALVYGLMMGVQVTRSYLRTRHDLRRIRSIVASEELILALGGELQRLSHSMENLQLPDDQAVELLAPQVNLTDLADSPGDADRSSLGADVVVRRWPVAASRQMTGGQASLWRPLLQEVAYFEHAKFYFIDGHFDDAALTEFVTRVGFKGLAKLKDGRWAGIKAKQQLRWIRAEDASDWQVVDWKLKELTTTESSQLLFSEALAEALPDAGERKRVRQSLHEEAVKEFYAGGGASPPWEYFSPISANQRPGISVVDVDRDGWDDLYIMVRRGTNQLLRNRGDGTFEEVAAEWGLDLRDFCSCGIFADFDNDGDPDLMLGRSMRRSVYLENIGHRFVARPVSDAAEVLPYLVVSMSAADYNGDGLLDIYFSTYRPAVLESIVADETAQHDQQAKRTDSATGSRTAAAGLDDIARHSQSWTDEFLSPVDARTFGHLAAKAAEKTDLFGNILDQVGPPNVLLVNRGQGRFEVAPESNQLALWRNTLQATWADFDEDGDPDLYVANDWATDNLFRNDGPRGFTEVTEELGTTEFGFAMGVSWGDFDRDGRQDIYVSNMYSKAGRRITSQIAELHPNYRRSVEGNFLYRQTDEGFRRVSGLEPPALLVAEAGWSWGGQFTDLDNDGFLDLYVLSGYFSAPPEFASQVDL